MHMHVCYSSSSFCIDYIHFCLYTAPESARRNARSDPPATKWLSVLELKRKILNLKNPNSVKILSGFSKTLVRIPPDPKEVSNVNLSASFFCQKRLSLQRCCKCDFDVS